MRTSGPTRRITCRTLLVALALVGAGAVHAADLTVLRTPAPAGVARSGAEPRPGTTSPTAADIERITEKKIDAWRSMPDVVSRSSVQWSSRAARRRGWTPESQLPTRSHRASAMALAAPGGAPDTMRVAFIRIDFLHDRGVDQSTGDGHFDLTGPDTTLAPIDRPPHNRAFYLDHLEALRRYYDVQSYHRVVITGDVWPRTQTGAYSCTDMADFGPWKFSTSIYGAAVDMFRSMLFAADTQSTAMGDRIPWDQYDRIVIIHAGSDLQSDVSRDSPEDIPSFTIGVSDTEAVLFKADTLGGRPGHPIDRASFIPEHINQDGYFGTINGVLAHECGHLMFGFVDLYNVDTGFPVVGLWSLMDSGNLAGSRIALQDGSVIYATGILPPSVDPWQRSFTTDSLTFPEASYGDTMAFRDSERHPDIRRVPLSSDEYLLLENRWARSTGTLSVQQGDQTRVILGPKDPYDYDALLPVRVVNDTTFLPGPGILAWHIDESVIPLGEAYYPCDTARANYECGFNTNPERPAISVLEADGLADLGDPNSPYILGAPRDPWFHSNNPVLGDSTRPNLRPHIGTYPHVRLNFLDEPDSVMHVAAIRTWQLPGWPVAMPFPPGGPQPLAIDVDGDRLPEIVWAGGREGFADSAGVWAIKANGDGFLGGGPYFFDGLGRRPNPVAAAIQREVGGVTPGPAVVVVTTLPGNGGPGGVMGRVWAIDSQGQPLSDAWPPLLPTQVTTAPVIAAAFQDTFVYVGGRDGRVYAIDLAGDVVARSDALPAPIAGRLAVYPELLDDAGGAYFAVAAGDANGNVVVLHHVPTPYTGETGALPAQGGWPVHTGSAPFTPDFLWIDFAGRPSETATAPAAGGDCWNGALTLVVHSADALWAYCLGGTPLPGWTGATGDTIVGGLAAGDPDGDGFPEVVTQTLSSEISYRGVDGHPVPGWPKRGTPETFRTASGPLTADLDNGGRTQQIVLNASGIVDAFDAQGKQPSGWPLATGIDAKGTPLLTDLNGDRSLELVVADAVGRLYAYSLPTTVDALAKTSWPMLGGDPQRSSALPVSRTPVALAPTSGPLVRGTLKAYPNPARRKPVQFAYSLTEPGEVQFRILDTSGHQVASFTRPARQSDNVESWDPGALPAGLYVAQLKFKGATSEVIQTVPLGILK